MVDPADVKIVPAILTNNPADFQRQFTEYPKFAPRIQLDVSDGTFTPDSTIQLSSLTQLPTGCDIDIHLITAKPSEQLSHVLRLKPSLCIMHAESGENLSPLFEQLKAAGIRTGVAILKQTYPGDIKQYLQVAQHALIFAGSLGKQGANADLLQTEKAKIIRSINPGIEIGWDGGATLANIRALSHADINIINVGGALSTSPNPADTYRALLEEKNKRGIAL